MNCAEGTRMPNQANDGRREEAKKIADEFAIQFDETEILFEQWKGPFNLARKLIHLGGDAMDYRDAVKGFCEETQTDWLEFWTEFVRVWDKVRFPDSGTDTLLLMAQEAILHPIPPPIPTPDPKYDYVFSIAWHLAVWTDPSPFLLPVDRMAAILQCSEATASRINCWLEDKKLLVCVEPHNRKRRQAKKMRLGPRALLA